MNYDVVIVGAGASGLMCAAVAGRRGRRVLVVDHNDAPGAKILISGGGRCNFTNHHIAPDCYVSDNPHFCKSALKRFRPSDFLDLLRQHHIPWHERDHGQLFCDRSAKDIVQMLLAECGAAGVHIRCSTTIGTITGDGPFRLATNAGPIVASSVVLASGGLSIPKIGATGFAHTIARRYDVPVVPPRPGLVPLTFAPADLGMMKELAGIAVPARVCADGHCFREALLFTHRGLSGPAVLQASSYWQDGGPVLVDWLPDLDVAAYLLDRKGKRAKAEIKTILAECLPARLADALTVRAKCTGQPIGQMGNAALIKLAASLKAWAFHPTGTEGWRTAEVTLGGIDTGALSSKTMEVQARPGLFVVGEAVDVAGWLGGYNFHWAWASGWVAGQFA